MLRRMTSYLKEIINNRRYIICNVGGMESKGFTQTTKKSYNLLVLLYIFFNESVRTFVANSQHKKKIIIINK